MNYPYITLAEVETRKLFYQNSMINRIDISLVGDVVVLVVKTHHGNLLENYYVTPYVGKILQVLYDLLELTDKNGRMLSSICKIPCRIVRDAHGKLIGIGHFMESKFILCKDLIAFCDESNE